MTNMERLSTLVKTLTSLKKVSIDIISNMVPIMSEIAESGSEIIGEISDRTGADVTVVEEYVQSLTLEIISDAEKVKAQIDAFALATESGPDNVDAKISSYPFLAEVWFGDIYEKDGIEALQILLGELKSELSKTTDDWIIEHASNHFM